MDVLRKINKKISKTMIIAFSLLIIGGLITYYQSVLNKIEVPEKVIAVIAEEDISKGEVITGSHLREIKVYKPDKLEKGINNMSKLIGKVALTTITEGKEITNKEIKEKNDWFNENEREVGVTFKDFTDIVGGTGRSGDIVDFVVSFPTKEDENKELIIKDPEVVVENIKLLNVFDNNNVSYKDSTDKSKFKPFTVLVKLTKEEEILIDKAKKKGRIYLRRHGNYIETNDKENKKQSKVIINTK